MPELPEVETTRRGIAPAVEGARLRGAVVRDPRLRRPVPDDLDGRLRGWRVTRVERRAKYLVFRGRDGALLLHLGMSGSLRIAPESAPLRKHDHVDVLLPRKRCLRFHDPRRFGLVLWASGDPAEHELLRDLGVEPLEDDFDGRYLHERSRGRRVAVKHFLMDGHVVVGVGNIYASEALFRAGIHPGRAAGRISATRYARLAEAVKETLHHALAAGGTTLRDYLSADGEPGYFERELLVYGRDGLPCRRCDGIIRLGRHGQRSTYSCPQCQR